MYLAYSILCFIIFYFFFFIFFLTRFPLSAGEMMMSLLWYYRPEHTKQGRQKDDMPDELFASKHRDVNSVACIDDRCYVLTFNEYCRSVSIIHGITIKEIKRVQLIPT